MDKCGICMKPAVQLFETAQDGVYACFKCQPLVPEITIDDTGSMDEASDPLEVSETSREGLQESNETSVYCGICHKTFQKNAQLQNHLRNHRAERRFVCTYCNKAFSQSNNLRAHLRIHTNERPYKCTECGKAFTQVTNLNNHVRLHTGERPFVCPEPGCNKAYAQVTNLNQHRKRHLGGRPVEATYDCTVCGQQFQQRNHMYSHRRAEHYAARGAARRHTCKLCELAFASERQLVAHVAQHVPRPAGADADADDHDAHDAHDAHDDDNNEGAYPCVFSSCAARLASPRAHTEHLLRAHQLRVHSARVPVAAAQARRGRPPKTMKMDSIEIEDDSIYNDIKIIKEETILPKLKVQSLFQ